MRMNNPFEMKNLRLRVRGLTLLELMITVALITILVAVALPSFLEAQVRSKVSRTKADLRTLCLGIEMYGADNNSFPDDAPNPRFKAGVEYSQRCLHRITTPVAYLTNSDIQDTFSSKDPIAYVNIRAQVEQKPSVIDYLAPGLLPLYKDELVRHEFAVVGVGPDRLFHNQIVGDKQVIEGLSTRTDLASEYDPTNGTVSSGDIAKTHLAYW